MYYVAARATRRRQAATLSASKSHVNVHIIWKSRSMHKYKPPLDSEMKWIYNDKIKITQQRHVFCSFARSL